MNNNGTISREEMLAGLKRLHLPITDKQFGKVIRRADADGGGSIDLNEFKAAFESGGRAEYVLLRIHEYVMSQICARHVTHMNHVYAFVTYYTWTSVKWRLRRRAALSAWCHVCMNALCHTRAGVRSRTWMRHVTYMSLLYHTNGFVFTCVTWRLQMCAMTYSHVSHEVFMCVCDTTHSRVWLSRADAMSRWCGVMSRWCDSAEYRTCIRRVACMNASCQSHTWRCHKWRAFSTLSQYTCMVTKDAMTRHLWCMTIDAPCMTITNDSMTLLETKHSPLAIVWIVADTLYRVA